MVEYEVDGTGRKKECDKDSPIIHLAIVNPPEVWTSKKIIGMIEDKDKEYNFWSYHYKNGKIDEKTKIEVEVVNDPEGKYLRTRKDETEDNNLLELPIWHLITNKEGEEKWDKC